MKFLLWKNDLIESKGGYLQCLQVKLVVDSYLIIKILLEAENYQETVGFRSIIISFVVGSYLKNEKVFLTFMQDHQLFSFDQMNDKDP